MVDSKTDSAELIDTVEVARLFGCSPRTVQRVIAKDELPVVRLPGSRLVRFRPSAIAEAWKNFEAFRNYRNPFDDGPGAVKAAA